MKTYRQTAPVFLLTLLLLFLGLWIIDDTMADIYRWRDAEGRWHFSDSPRDMPEHLQNKKGSRMESPEYQQITPKESVTNTPTATPRAGQTSSGDEISIPFIAREGLADRVIVNITFNNSVTAPILVDTGSPGLVISSSLASRLGLIDPDGNNLLVLISGIGGREIAARTIVDRINIGGKITEKFIPAHIIRNSAPAYQGLIGMDILSQYSLTIDSDQRRLIAKPRPPSENRPGGRGSNWWKKHFRELNFYMAFWDEQAELIKSSDSPYSRLTSRYARVEEFIQTQQNESKRLYDRLERYARSHSVPRHWRR